MGHDRRPRHPTVIDLSALRHAFAGLLRQFDRFHAEGTLDVSELDAALAAIRALPPLGGRLGRALAVLAAGPASAPHDTVAAFEVVRTTPGLRGGKPRRPPSNRAQAPTGRVQAPRLPGIG